MTPAQKAGLKVGDRIRVLEADGAYIVGDIATFVEEDCTTRPWFKAERYTGYYRNCFNIVNCKWEKIEDKPVKKFKNMIFIVGDDPACSERVQKALFDLGYDWVHPDYKGMVKFTDAPVLHTSKKGGLYNCWYDNLPYAKGKIKSIEWLMSE